LTQFRVIRVHRAEAGVGPDLEAVPVLCMTGDRAGHAPTSSATSKPREIVHLAGDLREVETPLMDRGDSGRK
jgi:hypothetical protein